MWRWSLNNLAELYDNQGRYADALPLVRRTIANKTAQTWPALPVLFGAQGAKLIAADEAIDDGLNVVQRASQTSAGEALNALAVRFAAGNDRLAQLVRRDQDLASEGASLDKAIIAADLQRTVQARRRSGATDQGSHCGGRQGTQRSANRVRARVSRLCGAVAA